MSLQTWRLDTPDQTIAFAAMHGRLPLVSYWGHRLNDQEDLETLARAHVLDVTGGMLDENPDLSICPEACRSFPGHPGLKLSTENGVPTFPKFSFDTVSCQSNTYLLFLYYDAHLGLRYEAEFKCFEDSGMIVAQTRLRSNDPVRLEWLAAPVLPASQAAQKMIDYSGRWCGEFEENETLWQAGIRLRENNTGRSGHEHFPALIVPTRGCTFNTGECYALHYGWSGGHKMIAEELADGRRHIQFGHAISSERKCARTFETAPLYLSFSKAGRNGCARAMQRHVRQYVVHFPEPQKPRPVHYNCWEAVYFDHDLEVLKEIATKAAGLGAERFVLDDGWFGQRDDDTSSLGDWWVDHRKYPSGLAPLIDHVHSKGMQFGIWFEPEMISPNSELYSRNPDWVLGGKDQILGRHQMVLDVARPEISEYLFDKISAVLKEYAIDYIKWDHNRVLPMPDGTQTQGIYALIGKLRETCPSVEIESCASGGGRLDYGILQYTQRVWLSDSNDALERAKIQHHAAQFLPAVVTGSHVGPRVCHTSGRIFDIRFRAWIAAQRHMGFEMDPRELSDDDAKTLRQITEWWKQERDWLMRADILRLDGDDPAVLAEQHIAEDSGQFIVFANKISTSIQILPRPLRFSGLEPHAFYRIELVNRDELVRLSRGQTALKFEDLTLSGQFLMSHGVLLPWSFPAHCWVLRGTRQI